MYILTNKNNHVLYIGVTSNLVKRIEQHRGRVFPGFTKRYNVTKLVYYKEHESIEEAIQQEKKMKNFVRRKKIFLVEKVNPFWKDLYEDII